MSASDFVRQMPGVSPELSRRVGIGQRLHIDIQLLGLLLILTVYGLFVLYSASGQSMVTIQRQGRFLLIAYIGMLVVAQFDVERIKRLAPWGYLLGTGLLVAVLLFGVGAKGAQRWLSLGGFRFQPSELMKLVLPIAVAWYLANRALPPRFKLIIASLLMIAIPTVLIARQPDLGTSILIASSGLFVLFLSGISWQFIFGAAGLGVLAAYPMWRFVLHDYQRQRILTLLNPESDKLGAGWNIIQSKTAIGSGGFEGKGWLNGTQSQLNFLPESHTDFIIAVLAEEGGLRDVLLLLLLYLLIIARGLWISVNAQHCFGRLLAGSITLTFFVYVFVNMGMVSGTIADSWCTLAISQSGWNFVGNFAGGFWFTDGDQYRKADNGPVTLRLLKPGPIEKTREENMYKALIVLVILFVSLSARAENYSQQELAQAFVDEMVEKHGFERAYLEGLMKEATRKDSILKAIARPAEKTKEWKDYRKIFIQQSRIRKGREFLETYADTLARAEQEFGVPAEIITAIIGVETRYGSNKGSYRVVDSLSTLAFDYPKRSKFFRGQLEQYLLLVREQQFDPLAIKGSYAGAMGYGQFIPSSYRDFAVDFDGDGVADIINNPVDAIGSVANYFSKHDWNNDELIVVQATAGKGHDAALIDKKLRPKYTVGQLADAGYTPYQPLDKNADATIMGLQGDKGMEYWIGLKNFYVITRYNHSRLYGMAVFQLSESF